MKWIELNEKSLAKLKLKSLSEVPFLVGSEKASYLDEWKYDIVCYLDLSSSDWDEESRKKCWNSLAATLPSVISCSCLNEFTEYTDDDLLDNYTHYCLLDLNKDTQEG